MNKTKVREVYTTDILEFVSYFILTLTLNSKSECNHITLEVTNLVHCCFLIA